MTSARSKARRASHDPEGDARPLGLRVLFLTWDGPQQTYLQSLFFPIFAGLRPAGIDVHVLQLTWATPASLAAVQEAARAAGIAYTARRVSDTIRRVALPAVVAYGAAAALSYARERRIDALFPRSLIPMAMAQLATSLAPKLGLVFDADGFMADERLDFGGLSADGLAYRGLRSIERRGVRRARAVVCRTNKAREILLERAAGDAQMREKIFVAPNGKDADVFTPMSAAQRSATRAARGVGVEAPWLVYVGSIGPQYCPERMLDCFGEIHRRRPDARLSCFTFQGSRVTALAAGRGLSSSIDVQPASPGDVPAILAAADLGLALRRESPSQRGISPIKVAEYLLAGLPVLASPVGDLEEQLGGSEAARLIDTADDTAPARVADWFLTRVLPERELARRAARALGLAHFELGRCVETYRRALSYRADGAQT